MQKAFQADARTVVTSAVAPVDSCVTLESVVCVFEN